MILMHKTFQQFELLEHYYLLNPFSKFLQIINFKLSPLLIESRDLV
jgi:hypothetical protein